MNFAPIQETIAAEKLAARAAIEKKKRTYQRDTAEDALRSTFEDQERARADAVASRKAEADLVRANRGNTIVLVSVTGRALRGAIRRAVELEGRVAKAENADGSKLSLLDEINLLDRLARTVERATRAAKETMVMERLLLGEPGEIIGIKGVGSFTEDEAIAELELGAAMAQRMRERKDRRETRLRLLQGGLYKAPGTSGPGKSNGQSGAAGAGDGPYGPTNGAAS